MQLNVLIVEDFEEDALLVLDELKKGGYEPAFERVETEETMIAALNKQTWDIIISDYRLPNFSGLDALKILHKTDHDIPFILVSGAIEEDTAIEAMKAGAHDFIMKNNLSRLIPAIQRELREARIRHERKQALKSLEESENLYRTIFETSGTAIVIIEEDTKISLANKKVEKMFGYSREELEGKKSWTEIMAKEELERLSNYHHMRRIDPESVPGSYETKLIDKQGNLKYVHVTVSMIPGTKRSVASLLDITYIKKAEEELKKARREWEEIFQAIGHPTIVLDPGHNLVLANRATVKLTGKTEEELRGKKCYEIFHGTDRPPENCPMEKMVMSKKYEFMAQEIEAMGGVFLVFCTPVLDEEGKIQKVIHIASNITDQKRAEEALRNREEELKKRVEELEDFYNIAIGRELRMIELKEEMEKLKEELEVLKGRRS